MKKTLTDGTVLEGTPEELAEYDRAASPAKTPPTSPITRFYVTATGHQPWCKLTRGIGRGSVPLVCSCDYELRRQLSPDPNWYTITCSART